MSKHKRAKRQPAQTPSFEQIGVQALIAGMAQFRADAAVYTRDMLDKTGMTKPIKRKTKHK